MDPSVRIFRGPMWKAGLPSPVLHPEARNRSRAALFLRRSCSVILTGIFPSPSRPRYRSRMAPQSPPTDPRSSEWMEVSPAAAAAAPALATRRRSLSPSGLGVLEWAHSTAVSRITPVGRPVSSRSTTPPEKRLSAVIPRISRAIELSTATWPHTRDRITGLEGTRSSRSSRVKIRGSPKSSWFHPRPETHSPAAGFSLSRKDFSLSRTSWTERAPVRSACSRERA